MSTLFEGLTNFGPQVGAELKRLGTQGAAELAHALFSGSPYLPYGPGQEALSPQIQKAGQDMEDQQRENEGLGR